MNQWLSLIESPIDLLGFILFLLVFPIYHGIYPWLIRVASSKAARLRFDLLRESWITGLIERRDILAAAQQSRNLTMVNSVLVSSSLILMGLIANVLVQLPKLSNHGLTPPGWISSPDAVRMKLYFLIFVLAAAFSYFMTSLRHLGHFVLVIGADPHLVKEQKGSPVKYFSSLINRASYRYTLGVRYLYSALALFGWLFDPWLFIAVILFFAAKFIGFQDFTHKVYID